MNANETQGTTQVYQYLTSMGGAEMSEIARDLRLSMATVRAIVSRLGAEVWTSNNGAREYVRLALEAK